MNAYLSSTQTLKLFLLTLALSVLAASCSDDPASSDDHQEDPPEIPNFEQNNPDLSFFDDIETSDENASYNNITQARIYAVTLSSSLLLGQIYTGFFMEANRENAEFEDGSWFWNYSYGYQGESASIDLVATETGSATEWSMSMSYDYGNGDAVEDYTVVEGMVSNDGNSGSWIFNELNEDTNEEVPALESSWTRSSEDELEIVAEAYEDGAVDATYQYTEEGAEFNITVNQIDEEDNITIYWNEDSGTGYYQIGADEQYCWDSEYKDTECS